MRARPLPAVTLSPTTDKKGNITLAAPNGIAFDNLGDLAAISSATPFGIASFAFQPARHWWPVVPTTLVVGKRTTPRLESLLVDEPQDNPSTFKQVFTGPLVGQSTGCCAGRMPFGISLTRSTGSSLRTTWSGSGNESDSTTSYDKIQALLRPSPCFNPDFRFLSELPI